MKFPRRVRRDKFNVDVSPRQAPRSILKRLKKLLEFIQEGPFGKKKINEPVFFFYIFYESPEALALLEFGGKRERVFRLARSFA